MSNNARYVDGMTNDEYRRSENGVSTSDIKNFMDDPASIQWSKEAPQDRDAMPAIDFGTDFHAYFLEPKEFEKHYRVMQKFNRRKADEKQLELETIAKWKELGIIAVTAEDFKKLESMRLSALANPTVKAIMALENGVAERSFFWSDENTGLLCKCRPDHLVTGINDSNRPQFMPKHCDTLVMDLKTIAGIDRIQTQIETLKYYVQDAFYSQGVEIVTRGNVCFVFVFVSTTMALGRFPVQCVMLTDAAKFDGKEAVTQALSDYDYFQNSDDSVWQTVKMMDRPMWATREEGGF